MLEQITRKLFTVDEYDQMIQAGIFREDARLELLGGEIVEMSPIGVRHAVCVNRLNRLLTVNLVELAIISVQNPIHLDPLSEPEPDIAVLQPRDDFYAGGHPEPEDVLLLIEVAESSLAYDRDVKIPRYAQAGIPEIWLVDVEGEQIFVYRQPTPQGYTAVTSHTHNETITPLAFPALPINTNSVMGEGSR